MKNRLTAIVAALLILSACSRSAEVKAPAPTPEISFQRLKPEQVIAAFRAAGLEAEDVRPMKRPGDYGLAPMTDAEGLRFFIPALGDESGGRVFSFSTPEDLEKMRRYYESLGRESAAFFSWVFVRDNILVQINGQLPEEKAREYERALLTPRHPL